MSSDTVYSAIVAHLAATWTETPVVYENERTIPDAAHVYVEVSSTIYAQESLGSGSSNLWREQGMVWLHVMVPSGDGSLGARGIARRLAGTFKNVTLLGGALRFEAMSLGLGRAGDEDGNWWTLPVRIEWKYDN